MAASAQKRKSSTPKSKRWSAKVTRESDALDLERDVFNKNSAGEIARSLKRSAEKSDRKKAAPFRSAMSMLNFYINRAGDNLSGSRLKVLDRAKEELRRLYGRPAAGESKAAKSTNKKSKPG